MKKKITFEKIKQEFIDLLKDKSPCSGEYRRVLTSTNEAELLAIIHDNLSWCSDKKVCPQSFLEKFNAEILLSSGMANTGIENTGMANSGDSNSGDRNSGDSNSGDRNSGDRNSGDSNSGDSNSGDSNSGDRNSGDWNSGDRNSGDSNSGNWNSGNWNSGDRNSGDSNSGYRNSGAFCIDPNPYLILFDKPTRIKIKDWENSRAVMLMNNIDPTIWVPMSVMTEDEKKANPKYETTEGYLKTIPIKEAWANMWHNLNDSDKKVFTDLENFDSTIFEKITGIKVL